MLIATIAEAQRVNSPSATRSAPTDSESAERIANAAGNGKPRRCTRSTNVHGWWKIANPIAR
jgi:hypothetical protein